jgi:hypothetical protein
MKLTRGREGANRQKVSKGFAFAGRRSVRSGLEEGPRTSESCRIALGARHDGVPHLLRDRGPLAPTARLYRIDQGFRANLTGPVAGRKRRVRSRG